MQSLISNIIRPFRFRYSLFDLGPKYTQKYQRLDSSILNDRGYKIQYSYYKNKLSSDICLVYAHCNSGCRVQGLQLIQPTINQGWNICLFDFVGSGISQGQYISLGYYQSIDLQAIISLVLNQGNNKIHLWGRSMGAATIILYLQQTKQIDSIISCVLDSPYSSLWKVIKQYSKLKINIPQFITQHLMEFIRKNIIKDHQFDIKNLQLNKKIQKIDLPIMFIASTHDTFVSFNHATQLYKCANSKYKVLEYIDKQHNSPRQQTTLSLAFQFMHQSISQKQRTTKQLKLLSKQKQFYPKITGSNMAQLIIKSPIKQKYKYIHPKFLHHQCISSTGNLNQGKYLYSMLPGKEKCSKFLQVNKENHNNQQQLKIQTQRYQEQKKKHPTTTTTITKNPHILQQSIIKLTLPQQLLLPHAKPQSSQQPIINYPLPPSNSTQKFNLTINPSLQLQPPPPPQPTQLNPPSHQQNKQNNLNMNNNYILQSQNNQDISPLFNSQIKNFNSIMTKRNHFNQFLSQQSLHKQQIKLYQNLQFKKNLSSKSNLIYLKNKKSSNQLHLPTKQPLHQKQSSKITTITHQKNPSIKPISPKKSFIKYNKSQSNLRQRINTYNIQPKYHQIQQQTHSDHLQQQSSLAQSIQNKQNKIYSSHSDISGQGHQKMQKLCCQGDKQNINNKINDGNPPPPTTQPPSPHLPQNPPPPLPQPLKRLPKLSQVTLNNTNTIHESTIQQHAHKQKKPHDKFSKKRHFQSNQDISYLTKYFITNNPPILTKPPQPPPQLPLQPKDNLLKTQKIIKIQLDKNQTKYPNHETKRKSSIKCIKPISNQQKINQYPHIQHHNHNVNIKYLNQFNKNNKSMNDCQSYRINPLHHQINNTNSMAKFKPKFHKKNFKINAIEISHHSFL